MLNDNLKNTMTSMNEFNHNDSEKKIETIYLLGETMID